MKALRALILMQLKDKISISYSFSFKNIIRKVIPFIVKFAIVAALSYLFFLLCGMFSIFSLYGRVPLVTLSVFLAILIIISIISCTIDLSHNLFMADDNKVLITYPVSGSKIFLSKIIVYYFSELYRNILITIPIVFGYGLAVKINIAFYFIMPLTFIFVSAIPVAVGMVLSIPTHYMMRFLDMYKPVKILLSLLLIAGFVWLAIMLIQQIPSSFNLIYVWPRIYSSIQDFLAFFQIYFGLFYGLSIAIVGMPEGLQFTYLNWQCWLNLLYLIIGLAVILISMFYLLQPFFIKMVAQSFETTKSEGISLNKKNKCNPSAFFSCVYKEIKLLFRDSSYISGLIGTYILTPLILLLLLQIYRSLSIGYNGKIMSYAFSILILTLPIFSSNAIISTIYSREGRAGYIKKTNPINPITQIVAKLVIPTMLSMGSLLVSMGILATYAIEYFSYVDYIVLTLAVLVLQLGVIIWAAYNDIKNPKNEEYATTGETFNNSNEIKTTILAFFTSIVFALFSYVLMSENNNNFKWVSIKLLIGSILYTLLAIFFFVKYIKCFYIDSGNRG